MAIFEPYIGFWFAAVHSSTMGVKRTSISNRYSSPITLNFEHKTNADTKMGTLLYRQNVKSRTISFNFAFDNLTLLEFEKMKQWLSIDSVQDLIFDEDTDITYRVKINGQPKLTYLCFDEVKDGVEQRIYKGEGQIEFIQFSFSQGEEI